MDIGECGVCGEWASGRRFPSGSRRPNGTTPMDNFICFRCHEEARTERELGRPSDQLDPHLPNRCRTAATIHKIPAPKKTTAIAVTARFDGDLQSPGQPSVLSP